ncbi:MAG TPA: hypothetical protein VIJ27_10365 [Mucilaginibacter sp.]
MNKQNNDPMALLEWEFFDWPLDFTHIRCQKGIYQLPSDSKVSLFRGEDYKLMGNVTGILTNKDAITYKGGVTDPAAGEFMEMECIEGSKTGWETIALKGALLGAHKLKGPLSMSDPRFSFDAKVITFELDYTDNGYTPEETEKLLEFYICGQTNFFWPRSTKRKEVTRTAKIRIGLDEDINDPIDIAREGGGSGSDFFLIETPSHYIIVQEVAQHYLPEWSKGILFEYRRKDRTIPGVDERKSISEIVGFILGTHLLKVGESHLDKSDLLVKKTAYSPWGDNVMSKCSASARPPVSFNHYEDWGKIEIILNQLVPAYLEKRDAYNLKDVLWKYWIARELAIGTNLPILSSGLETLAEAYIAANKLTRTYSKNEKDQYHKLISDDLKSVKDKLDAFDFKKRVIDKLENPFSIGVGEKIKLFFTHLKFNFNSKAIENQAMQARNAMTHGPLDSEDKEVKKYIKLTHAYESVFHRVLLRVLDYEGDYIDYSAAGHPSLQMEENLGSKL